MAIKIDYAVVGSALSELKAAVPQLPAEIEAIQGAISKLGNSDIWAGDSASVVSSELSRTNNVLNEFYNAANDALKFLDKKYTDYQNLESLIKRGTDGQGTV